MKGLTPEQEQLQAIGRELISRLEGFHAEWCEVAEHLNELEEKIKRIEEHEKTLRELLSSHDRLICRLTSLEYRVDPNIVAERVYPLGAKIVFAEEKKS